MSQKIRQGCTAIILKDNNKVDNILFTFRNKNCKSMRNQWALPGGEMEDSETPEEAIIREIKEETNLDVTPTSLILIQKENVNNELWINYVFICKVNVDSAPLKNNEPDKFNYIGYTQIEAGVDGVPTVPCDMSKLSSNILSFYYNNDTCKNIIDITHIPVNNAPDSIEESEPDECDFCQSTIDPADFIVKDIDNNPDGHICRLCRLEVTIEMMIQRYGFMFNVEGDKDSAFAYYNEYEDDRIAGCEFALKYLNKEIKEKLTKSLTG